MSFREVNIISLVTLYYISSDCHNFYTRANVTQQKYQKQIEWRRNKVKEMLIRGYSQYEISNTLHISQPTISRDMKHVYEDKKKRQKKYGNELVLEVQNTMAGLGELIKKAWTIVDDSKTKHRERMKAISLIMQCYNKRLELLSLEPQVNNLKEYIDNIMKKERELSTKEKILEAHREGRKLSWHELSSAVDDNRQF
jgi:predicted transcriptional regulator